MAKCKFCREGPHEEGKLICPVLYNITCGCCGATGEKAHTTSHCPHLKCRKCSGRHLDQYCGVKKTPKEGYICRKCNIPGHWMSECTKVEYPPPPAGYKCKVCDSGLHWVQQCDKDKEIQPPAEYVCKLCNIPGHWIKHCTATLAE